MIRLWFVAFAAVLAGFGAFEPRTARAQGPGLGGYGASSSMAAAGMGASGPIIPYGGSLSGFHALSNGRRRHRANVLFPEFVDDRGGSKLVPPIVDESQHVDVVRSDRRWPRATTRGSLFSPRLGAGMNRSMDIGSESVMPPNFGYPFYQPPSLLSPSSAFMGMSSM